MSDVANAILTEAERLESLFMVKLAKLGHSNLVDEYQDIIGMRTAASIAVKRAVKSRATKSGNSVAAEGASTPNGFVLIEEVRSAIQSIKSERFRASRVFEILQDAWPQYITQDKKASIGATLSNLVTNRELSSEKDGQRKVWYKAVDSGNNDDVPPDSAPKTFNFSGEPYRD